jgi:hypothetical protein
MPPGHEGQQGRLHQINATVVIGQQRRDLSDGEHKDQVQEQLQIRGVPLLLLGGLGLERFVGLRRLGGW